MSAARRGVTQLVRPATANLAARSYTSTAPLRKKVEESPRKMGLPIFPAPVDPYSAPEPSRYEVMNEPDPNKPEGSGQKYSKSQIKLVKGIARFMGYNTKAVTSIRETMRMMKGIVEAAERDREFWYDECRLPETFQSFFKVHLLYLLMMTTRIRALPDSTPSHPHPIPESADPNEPAQAAPPTNTGSASSFSPFSFWTKTTSAAYHQELVNHFFELSESQLRRVLGPGERERVVKKYLEEFGQQWRGQGLSFDYAVGLAFSEDPALSAQGDAELASWFWRYFFNDRGLPPPAPGLADLSELSGNAEKELEMLGQIEKLIRFVRKEMARLDEVSHRDVIDGNVGRWGMVGDATIPSTLTG